METENYKELIENLNDPNKIKEATSKRINASEILKKLKKYYHKVSHDDYYAAKALLDKNVELKKNIREEIRKLELLKDKATLTDEEELEVTKTKTLLENQNKTPEKEKIITNKINEIEEQLKQLKILTQQT